MWQSIPQIEVLQPQFSFLDDQLAERITLRTIQSDANLGGIFISSSGRNGVYRALCQQALSRHIHVVVHDVTPDNVEMVRKGIVGFIIGQDSKTAPRRLHSAGRFFQRQSQRFAAAYSTVSTSSPAETEPVFCRVKV